jgi:hypothetical protein
MELPINQKDLKTIVSALALGGDSRLYHLLKDRIVKEEYEMGGNVITGEYSPKGVQVMSESDEYGCQQGDCDI